MAIKAELNFLEFYKTKHQLESGYYRVIESDGDVNIAVVKACVHGGHADVSWLTEDEYIDLQRREQDLSWSMDHDEFRRIQPEDLAEAEYDYNHNSELFDRLVYGIEPEDLCEQKLDSNGEEEVSKPTSLADLLRVAMSIDPRSMTDVQYIEHCEAVVQDKRNGVNV